MERGENGLLNLIQPHLKHKRIMTHSFPELYRLVDNFQWHGAFLIIGAIVLLNVIFGALFRPLVPSSTASETTTTSNQDVVNLDEVKSSLYKISSDQEKSVSLNHSFINGPNTEISQNTSFANTDNNVMNSPVNITF